MVKTISQKILKLRKFLGKKELRHYNKLVFGAVFKSAKLLEEQGKPIAAAKKYLSIAKKNPKTKIAATALFNASVIYLEQNMLKDGENAFKILFKYHPRSKLTYQLAFKIALFKEEHLKLKDSLKYYKITVKSKQYRMASVYSLYLINRALHSPKQASRYYLMYKKKDILTVLEMSKQLRNKKLFNRLYAKINRRTPSNIKIKALIYKYQLYNSKKYFDRALKIALLSPNKVWSDSKYQLSKIYYNLLKTNFDKYNKLVIDTTDAKVTQSLFRKKQYLLSKLTTSLATIIKLGDPFYTSLATLNTANLLHNFYTFIINSPIPENITEEEKKQYTTQIEQLATPYKTKAVAIYNSIIEAEEKNKTISIFTRLAKKNLNLIETKQQTEYSINIPRYYYALMD